VGFLADELRESPHLEVGNHATLSLSHSGTEFAYLTRSPIGWAKARKPIEFVEARDIFARKTEPLYGAFDGILVA
jgi:hypothetical protein